MRLLRGLAGLVGFAFVLLWGVAGCGDGGSSSSAGGGSRPGAGSGPGPGSAPAGGGAVAEDAGVKRIIILNNGDSPFWDAARAGMDEAAQDLKLKEAGLQAVFESNDATPQGQLEKLRQFTSQSDIAAVGLSAIDGNNAAIADQMRALRKKGVQVVTIDSDVDRDHHRDARLAFIGTDNRAGGRELGKCAKGLRPDGGKYVTFVGRSGAQNAIERIDGFAEGAGDRFKALDKMEDENDRTRARDNVRNAIRNHPDLNTLVGIWSYNAPAIADVVKETGRRKDFAVVVFDAEPLAIQQIGEGLIDAMVVQNPYQMGYQGVRLMKALAQKDRAAVKTMLPNEGKPDGDLIDTGLKVVVPDRGSPLKAELFDQKTEFLKLSDFSKWLEKYHLTGS
jgi:ribose transport system substrate-binding protein